MRPRQARPRLAPLAALATAALVLGACGGGSTQAGPAAGGSATAGSNGPVTVRLVTHDSFAVSTDLLDEFERGTGITVEIVTGGDAGEVVNKAVLAAGRPDGDVLFGVDTTLLSRALDAGVFDPYRSDADGQLRPELTALDGDGTVTPVDDGDVCVNIDDTWFRDRGIDPPATLEDLADPRYRGLLVVQNPATSSPGLAFLLATVARYGDQWPAYWERLRANDVAVVNGWTEAYEGEFTAGGGGGTRPLVVSYSSSPAAEIVYAAEPKPTTPSTSVMADGCYRQVEFAGVLRGTEHPAQARAVVDWLVSPGVQADVPLSMFVFPARSDVPLPQVFQDVVDRPADPLELAPEAIAANRDAWVREWTEVVLR